MQTAAKALVVQQKVVTQILLSCSSLDGKCILQFAILYPLMQIFFQHKNLKVFAQLGAVENIKYRRKWCKHNILHNHFNIKCILFIKSFLPQTTMNDVILHKGKILNYNFHFHSICRLIVILLFPFLFVLGQSQFTFNKREILNRVSNYFIVST